MKLNGDKWAESITLKIGSWAFVLGQTFFLIVYLLCNATILTHPFDPFPFVFLNLTLSFQAAYTGPIVLMAQNAAAERDRQRQERDRKLAEATLHLVESQQKILQYMASEVTETNDDIRELLGKE